MIDFGFYNMDCMDGMGDEESLAEKVMKMFEEKQGEEKDEDDADEEE